MLRPKIGVGVAGLSAVAAIASVVITWPAAVAQSTVKITAKHAALSGFPASAEREEIVAKLIVKMRDPSARLAQSQMAAAGVGVKSIRTMAADVLHVVLDAPLPFSEAKAVAARLANNPAIEYVEPDVSMRPFAVPNDPNFATKQWNLFAPTTTYSGAVAVPMGQPAVPNVNAPATGGANLPTAWDRTQGDASVIVAIIDTGIVNHPDLNNKGLATLGTYAPNGRFLAGYDFISDDPLGLGVGFVANDGDGRDNDPADPGDAVSAGERSNPLCNDNTPNQLNQDAPSTWHGTHSAGVVAAETNNVAGGVAGIGWNIRIVPVRALGKCGGAMSDVADAIKWAAGVAVTTLPVPVPAASANPAKVILVGAGGKAGIACSVTLQSAVDAAINAGATVVAAAGNEGAFTLSAPANCSGVVAVTAHAINGENASYSNVNAAVALSAPGGGPPATFGFGGPTDAPAWDGYYVWSTTPSGTAGPATPPIYSGRFGTSTAAAHVAGVAALIKSITPNASVTQVRGALTTSTRAFPDLSSCAPGRPYAGQCGSGMLDATRALQAAGPPFVVTAPRSITVTAGSTASFAIEAVGVATYQWTRAGANIAGATGPTYTTAATAAGDNNVSFAVVMTNSFGTTTSPAAVLTVNSGGSNSPSGGGALPLWQLLLLSSLLLATRVRVADCKQ